MGIDANLHLVVPGNLNELHELKIFDCQQNLSVCRRDLLSVVCLELSCSEPPAREEKVGTVLHCCLST